MSFPYIKDLRIMNRDLSQVILVDNSLYTYWFNVDNGVPITSFMGEQDDELLKL
jgi:CTD small phosphatase-like protein 2